jgi:hypothetical protein
MTRVTAGFIAVLAACALGLLSTGCGGDDSDTGGGGDTLTAAAWRLQADAICTDAKTQLDALGQPTEDDLAGFLQKGLAISIQRADKLAALQPPTELAETQSKAVTLLRDTNARIQSAIDRIGSGTPAAQAITEVDPAITKNGEDLDALAKQAGLSVCGAD